MTFSSLKNVLLCDREDQKEVSFSDEECIHWPQFVSDIKKLTATLNELNIDRWAICCDDSYHFCVAFFATIYADKKMVLPGNRQPAMLSALSDHFDAIIHDDSVTGNVNKEQLLLPCADIQPATEITFSELELSQVEITLFTSGSSGLPKAICKSLYMLDTEIMQLESQWGNLLADTRIISTVSHQHIYGLLFRILWPLCAGRAFQRVDLVYPEQLVTSADNNHTLISSPALLKRLPNNQKCSPYRAIFSSGGPLSFTSAQQCKQLFTHHPFEVFGSTETGGIGYRQQIQEATAPWTFFPGIISQLDKNNCLSLCSPWIDKSSWYQTSDQCELLRNNQFMLKGRMDRIVKIEEKRISLIEVEHRLNQLEWIEESAVLVIEDFHRLSLGAVLKLNNSGKNMMEQLGKGKFWITIRQSLRLWLEPVGIPRHYRVISEIPVNKQGKRIYNDICCLFENKNSVDKAE